MFGFKLSKVKINISKHALCAFAAKRARKVILYSDGSDFAPLSRLKLFIAPIQAVEGVYLLHTARKLLNRNRYNMYHRILLFVNIVLNTYTLIHTYES